MTHCEVVVMLSCVSFSADSLCRTTSSLYAMSASRACRSALPTVCVRACARTELLPGEQQKRLEPVFRTQQPDTSTHTTSSLARGAKKDNAAAHRVWMRFAMQTIRTAKALEDWMQRRLMHTHHTPYCICVRVYACMCMCMCDEACLQCYPSDDVDPGRWMGW